MKKIQVYASWDGLIEPVLMGNLQVGLSRGKEIFSFEYDLDWLKNQALIYPIDPALQLFSGVQYSPQGQENFGVFLDSAPDRWGRFLMDRREAQQAREENKKARKLLVSDYLLGVFDAHRLGALRFKTESNGPFLDNNVNYASPPWASLRELEQASFSLEQEDAEEHKNYSKWLKMLIAPGGSLGGARPKASVIDGRGNLWIAKFPSRQDEFDIGAWEMVAHRLAQHAKINVPEAKLERFCSTQHTFLSKRFDRIAHQRLHFASAMTLLQRTDGDDASSGVSYLELAEFISRQGSRPDQDLKELWRRIVFSMFISNTDDHLRNHGFILGPRGWALSPAFDINPNPHGDGLKLNISELDNAQDLNLAQEVAPYFRLKPEEARGIIQEIGKAVKLWQKEAAALGLTKKEQERMSEAFRVAERSK